MKRKRGEVLGLSFGMIFSIFLIVFFIIIAFIVIKNFLGVQDCGRIGIFIDKLKADVTKTWNSQIDSHNFIGILPNKVSYVCIADLSNEFKGTFKDLENEITLYGGNNENLFLYPTKIGCNMPAHNIPHIDVNEITKTQNPYCIEVNKGKVNLVIEKELNDPLVKIS